MPKMSGVTKYRSFADRVLARPQSVGTDAFRNAVARMGYQTPSVAEGADYELVRWTNDYWLMVTLFRNHWIARKIIEIPAKDMVKAWPRLNCELTPDQISDFDRTIERTLTPLRIKKAITWARLFGGAGALMVIKGHENILDTPLNLDEINPGSYKGLIVFDRWSGITPKGNQAQDIESPLTFGLPEFYTVHGQNGNEALFDVHASRIMRFIGPDVPTPEHEANMFWGISVCELIMEEMRKRDNASWSILQLLFRAQILTQVNPELAQLLSGATSSAGALTRFQQTMQAQNELLSNQSMLLLGKDGKLESHQYTFGGVADVLDRFEVALAACSIPSIPYSKLFGKNASGLGQINEADERNYEEAIAGSQNDDLRPQLMQQLYPVVCMSEFGEVPDDLDIKFPSIRVLSEENKSELAKSGVEAILAPFNAGVTSQKLTGQELAQLAEKTEIFSNITPEIIEEMDDKPQQISEMGAEGSQAERSEFGSTGSDEWNEADHPRGQPENAGQFGPGGSGGKSSKVQPSETSSSTQSKPPSSEHIAACKMGATMIARELHYNGPIHIETEAKTFMLNGQTMNYAGSADLNSREITLYPSSIPENDPDALQGIVSHEIGHVRFQIVLNMIERETKQLKSDPDAYHSMRADGSLLPEYQKQYPLYTMMNNIDERELYKEDGVSEYSKQWWKSWNDGVAQTSQAMHETFAEIARYDLMVKHNQLSELNGVAKPKWRKFYAMINKVYDS